MAVTRRPRKIPTAQNLNNVALFYLSRYAASEFSLRQVLKKRLMRAARDNPAFAADHALREQLLATIESIIEKHKKAGILNDAAFADMKISGLRRAGRSARAIKQKLGRKGIAAPLINDALNRQAEDDTEDAEVKAATIFARRKKLGPYRQTETDLDRRRKDFATMARAGFSLDVVRKVLGKDVTDSDGDF